MNTSLSSFFISIAVVFGLVGVCYGGELRKNFYQDSCPLAEDIVRDIIWKHVATNSTLPAKFLRMHFHDCFIRVRVSQTMKHMHALPWILYIYVICVDLQGCDGSILLDSTANNIAEKEAIPNQSLAGFDVIEEVKTNLEYTCPGVVSCADIVALAARDSVSFQVSLLEIFSRDLVAI